MTGDSGNIEEPTGGLDRLPTFLALAVDHWDREQHPVQRLWRLCDAVELLVRYLAAVGLAAQVLRGGGRLPMALARRLAGGIERPTFGLWLKMAEAALAEGDEGASAVLDQMRGWFRDKVRPVVFPEPGGEGDPAECGVLPLRNLLAHGGGMTERAALRLLEECGHEARARALFQALTDGLAGHRLVFVDPDGGGVELRGLQPRSMPSGEVSEALAEHTGHVVLLASEGGLLSLWPLFGYGLPEVVRAGRRRARQGTEPVPQVYVRAEPSALLYNALGGDLPFSERSGDALECFRRLFRVEREPVEAQAGQSVADFADELALSAEERVGRDDQLETVVEAAVRAREGILWLSGSAGAGKSVLMASVACDPRLAGDPGKLLVIPHRFKVGDGRCSRESFLRQAVHRLQEWKPLLKSTPEGDEPVEARTAEPELLARRFRDLLERVGTLKAPSAHELSRAPRVLFLLDGLDEIARLDPAFVHFPFKFARANTVWLCAGRPELELRRRFEELGRCTVLFPPTENRPEGGLPPMRSAEVRAMLLTGAERMRYLLLGRDREDASGGEVRNDFVEAVVERAAGLPIYVRLVLEDLVRDQVRPDRGTDLPESLEVYYEELLSSYGIDDVHQVLTPLVATLAVAREPLDRKVLQALLTCRSFLTMDEEAADLVERALGAAGAVLRQAPTPDGGFGYTLYHDSFREHVLGSGQTVQAVRTAREAMGNAALDWDAPVLAPARRYLLRRGGEHLLVNGKVALAAARLANFEFLHRFLREFGPVGVSRLVEDFSAVRAAGADSEFTVRDSWFRQCAHLLRRGHPGWPSQRILVQVAVEHGEDSPVSKAAAKWIGGQGGRDLWLGNVQRPGQAPESPSRVVFSGHQEALEDEGLDYIGVVRPVVGGAFVLGDRTILSWSGDGTLRRWDADTGDCLFVFAGHTRGIRGARQMEDGTLLSWSYDGTFRTWDPATGVELSRGTIERAWQPEPCSARWSQAGGLLLWSPGRMVELPGDYEGFGRGSAVDLGRERILVWDDEQDRSVDLWEGPLHRTLQVLPQRQAPIWGAMALPKGGILFWAGDGSMECCFPDGSRPSATWRGHSDAVTVVRLLSDGTVVSGSDSGCITRWDGDTGAVLNDYEGHEGPVNGFLDLPEGTLLSWSEDGLIKRWHLGSGECLATFRGHEPGGGPMQRYVGSRSLGGVSGCRVLSDGSLVSWSDDGTLRLWDLDGGKCLGILSGHQGPVRGVEEFWDGTLLSWSEDGTLRRWCRTSCRGSDGDLPVHSHVVGGALALADGTVVTWSEDGTVRRWDPTTGLQLNVVARCDFGMEDVVLAEGCLLVCQESMGPPTIYRQDGTYVTTFECVSPHSWESVSGMVAGSEGTVLARNYHGDVHVWEVETGRYLETLTGEEAARRYPQTEQSPARIGAWQASEDGCVRLQRDGCDKPIEWHATGRWWARVLLPCGVLVATSGPRVAFLQLHAGPRAVTLEEAEKVLRGSVPDTLDRSPEA